MSLASNLFLYDTLIAAAVESQWLSPDSHHAALSPKKTNIFFRVFSLFFSLSSFTHQYWNQYTALTNHCRGAQGTHLQERSKGESGWRGHTTAKISRYITATTIRLLPLHCSRSAALILILPY